MTKPYVRRKRPTQVDVARAAGVSQTTVSLVLNQRTDISVPDGTRQRVLDVIAELGYIPDRTARSLRTSKTYTIAGIIPDITNPFYPDFERGVQDSAEQCGYDLMIFNTDGDAAKERKALRSVQQSRADGIVGVFFHLNMADFRPLLEANLPVVRMEPRCRKTGQLPLDSLYVDNARATNEIVTYLVGQGRRRIVMLTGGHGPRDQRVMGYRQAVSQAGLPELVVEAGGYDETDGSRSILSLLGRRPLPDAVFAANDLIAIGAMRTIRTAGLRIPEDIAVVGFDDIPAANFVTPALTTVAQHPRLLGRRAAEMLFERLAGTYTGPGRCEEAFFKLVIRETA